MIPCFLSKGTDVCWMVRQIDLTNQPAFIKFLDDRWWACSNTECGIESLVGFWKFNKCSATCTYQRFMRIMLCKRISDGGYLLVDSPGERSLKVIGFLHSPTANKKVCFLLKVWRQLFTEFPALFARTGNSNQKSEHKRESESHFLRNSSLMLINY